MPDQRPIDASVGSGPGVQNRLVTAPILPTLVALSAPNMLALTVQSLSVIAETSYIGRIGTNALAAMALVFPMIMLTQMLSSGAMGGGVSSAISRALGAGDLARARLLAVHAIAIGLLAGIAQSVIFIAAGPWLYAVLGGRGEVLAAAIDYSWTFFAGAISVWLFNTLISIVRGTGNMRLSSSVLMCLAAVQIALGGSLSLGLGPFPALGLRGVAIGQITAFSLGTLVLGWVLVRGRSRLTLRFAGARMVPEMFRDILRVGAFACLSPLQSILVVLILARYAATFGTDSLAGFGIGIRLELLLVPIAFAIGMSCVPMVGMAIGAGQVDRARRVAWTGAALSAVLIGGVGIVFAVWPDLWGRIFTTSETVLDALETYLSIAGLAFPAYGVGLCLYFASQGSGRIMGPVLAGTVRLVIVVAGGFVVLGPGHPFSHLSLLVALAMLGYGLSTVLFVWLTPWGRR